MRQPGTAQRRGRAVGKGASPRHLSSHRNLLHDVSAYPTPSGGSRRGRPDAIIVPATRPPSALTGLIELAADLGSQLVVLCSRQSTIDRVADRVGKVHGARALAVQLDDYQLPVPDFRTSSDEFTAANGGRTSDLSLKRNFGLLLARLRGWHKIIYVDDDITLRRTDLVRVTEQLDRYEFAGMRCPWYPDIRWYPDNSVFCHARRLAKLQQDVFVSGGVLGVNCRDLPLPFFPDIYNEDWFFFGEAAAQRSLANAGDARQKTYDPFADPARAHGEEFGDLLAEGLYARIESLGDVSSFREVVKGANASYWSSYIADRRMNLQDIRSRLGGFTGRSCSDNVAAAMKSLDAADQLYTNDISAEHCVQFLEAWQVDIVDWEKTYTNLNTQDSERDALDWLGATTWETVR